MSTSAVTDRMRGRNKTAPRRDERPEPDTEGMTSMPHDLTPGVDA